MEKGEQGSTASSPTIEGLQFDASLTKFQNLIRADYLPEQFS